MNDNQNPNVNNNGINTAVQNGVNTSLNQNVVSGVQTQVGVTQTTQPMAQPQMSAPAQVQPASPTPMPAPAQVQPAVPTPMSAPAQVQPVAPTPMSAPAQVQPVAPTPMPAPAQVQPVAPVSSTPVSQEESPFFTPVSVQPEVQAQVVLPEITPATPAPQEAPVQEVNNNENVQTNNKESLEVIETGKKNKASNAVLIIFLVLLILFVFNIDTVISIYEQFKESNNVTNPNNKDTNNLTDGFILINDNTSFQKLNDIKFYNFRKSQGTGITFSYEVLAKIDDAKSLEIYIELYNSEKEIIYKGLYNPTQKLEKDTVRTYTINVEDYIYDNAFYALVKKYNDAEIKRTSVLTCSKEDQNYTYKNTFNFANNGLINYEVIKQSKRENDESLNKEYEELKDMENVTLENDTLTYKIDVNKDNGEYVNLYESDTTLKVIKDNEISKEWKCE